MKVTIRVASKIRGFLVDLFSHSFENIEFINECKSVEITGLRYKLLRKIYESFLFDYLGIIQVVKKTTECDAMISYNRFMKTNKPYYIICENPTALFHYRLNRKKGFVARFLIPNRLKDDKLRGIICLSDACALTFNKVVGTNCEKICRIYPLINDVNVSRSINNGKINCLFVSSNFELKSGLEVVEVASRLPDITFTIVTREETIDNRTLNKILSLNNVNLMEFNLSKKELYKQYLSSDILLHPSRQDSSPMVVLEAIKHGLPVIATSLYAIPEMVIDGYNGFLTQPKYCFFTQDNMPNPDVWNHRKETIYSNYLDNNIVCFLMKKIQYFDSDRKLLFEFSKNSTCLSYERFGVSYLQRQWENFIFNTIK